MGVGMPKKWNVVTPEQEYTIRESQRSTRLIGSAPRDYSGEAQNGCLNDIQRLTGFITGISAQNFFASTVTFFILLTPHYCDEYV